MTESKTIKGRALVALATVAAATVVTAGFIALQRKPQVVYVACPDYVPMAEAARKATH